MFGTYVPAWGTEFRSGILPRNTTLQADYRRWTRVRWRRRFIAHWLTKGHSWRSSHRIRIVHCSYTVAYTCTGDINDNLKEGKHPLNRCTLIDLWVGSVVMENRSEGRAIQSSLSFFSSHEISILTWSLACVCWLRPYPAPTRPPELFNLQLQDTGNRDVYLADSSAMARRIRSARFACITQLPTLIVSIPTKDIATPTPVRAYNGNEWEWEVAVPTMLTHTPPTMHRQKITARTFIIVFDEMLRLMLWIDCWNSSWLTIPLRCTGYVESNSTFRHPAERSKSKNRVEPRGKHLLWIVGTYTELTLAGTPIMLIYFKKTNGHTHEGI